MRNRGWEKYITTDIKETQCEGVHWIQLAEDNTVVHKRSGIS